MKKLLLIFVGLLIFSVNVYASDYPSKPIEVIVAYSAGGGTDVGARILAKAARKYIPQPLVIVNRPGAAGEIGFTALSKAKTDGYTIGFINQPTTLSLPYRRKVGYKNTDFKYIINIVEDPGTLSLRTESPYKTFDDFIKAVKDKPGVFTISNAGVGSDAHMSILDFAKKAKISVIPVPFKGAAPARTAALGGHVDAVVMKVGEAKTYVQSKQIRVLAVMANERVHEFPDVPTFKEKGFNVVMASSRGIAGPIGIADSVAQYLHDKLKQTIEGPEFIAAMKKTGIAIKYMGLSDYEKYCEQLDKTFGPLWAEMKGK
jgi:tripartite-type tricarboxylate transporter receptor subunit TctC